MSKNHQLTKDFATDNQRWQAIVRRDKRADGAFIVAVKTTGIYCRPWCPSRRPRRENVRFFATPAEAERAGFRACKRCRPKESINGAASEAVAKVCALLAGSSKAPDLDRLAREVHMSPSRLHRLFKSMTGLTPKAYAAGCRQERMRGELARGRSVTAAIYRAGYGSSGRFYENAKDTLGMRPSAYRAGGRGMEIQFTVGECSLGSILVAATNIGICSIMLGDQPKVLVQELTNRFPRANITAGGHDFERLVAKVIAFVDQPGASWDLPLDVRGTAFQKRVWQELCAIPRGQTRSYAEVAQRVGRPQATRAVAQACAANHVAVAIPCHRVVRSDGSLSGYRWGVERKAKLLMAEKWQNEEGKK
jgi:AraC family transcriptional regulator of adaptative response/methylated-DNA-[protein]-cysteine methyltransferase